jgi:hypothetical protein
MAGRAECRSCALRSWLRSGRQRVADAAAATVRLTGLRFSANETGWLQRADIALDRQFLSDRSEAYLRETFLGSRDRVSTIATTVAAVGTAVLALLAVAVAVSGAVSVEKTQAREALEARQLVELRCGKEDAVGSPCANARQEQAENKQTRAERRRDEVRRISDNQLATGSLMLLGFLAALGSQLLNPIAPPAWSTTLLEDWRLVRDRYRQKRRLIEAALWIDAAGVVVLILTLAGQSWAWAIAVALAVAYLLWCVQRGRAALRPAPAE